MEDVSRIRKAIKIQIVTYKCGIRYVPTFVKKYEKRILESNEEISVCLMCL